MNERSEIVVEAGRLKLTFLWKEDRYQHRISASGKTRRSAAKAQIANPVFTEIHQQGDLLFLSGHGHASHWSASVQPDAETFVFDIACRASEDIGEIGSGYIGNGLMVEPHGNAAGNIRPDAEDLRSCPAWSITPTEGWGEFPCTLRYGYRIRPAE